MPRLPLEPALQRIVPAGQEFVLSVESPGVWGWLTRLAFSSGSGKAPRCRHLVTGPLRPNQPVLSVSIVKALAQEVPSCRFAGLDALPGPRAKGQVGWAAAKSPGRSKTRSTCGAATAGPESEVRPPGAGGAGRLLKTQRKYRHVGLEGQTSVRLLRIV